MKKSDSSKKAIPAAPRAPQTNPEPESNAVPDAAIGAAAGAAAGAGLWGLAMPFANVIGFSATGITGGSTAASMMSTAAIANGGGVASGSAVAILQSVGAVGLATPIGLGLVAGGAAIGGVALLAKAHLTSRTSEQVETEMAVEPEEKGLWTLIEISSDSEKPTIRTFNDDYKARNAFLNSSAVSKALFDPEQKIVLELGWDSL
ncbi:Interferon alpha-inducible protein 27-like protein 1 [Phytophthora citrophthora]|uniref:Interferon alpha-inducible protein 27-like protein 1 n=1 Tax=Phytophthora citrophthora TaxID=4793 RepID=A0AAD9G962_9STRA|nr:Interferon alpha-inducible protein 27-like protein 1 [Phytophthora citrophthora]